MIKQIIRYFKNINYTNVDMTEYAKKKRNDDQKIISKINKEKRC